MKKSFLFFLFFHVVIISHAQKDLTMYFNLTDYQFFNKKGLMHIVSSKSYRRSAGGLSHPNLPYYPCRVLIPANLDSISYSLSFAPQRIYTNISMAANPMSVPTDGSVKYDIVAATSSINVPVFNEGVVNRGGCKYLYLKVTPFVFDANKGTLSFVSQVKITFPELAKQPMASPVDVDVNLQDLVSQVANPEDAEAYYKELSRDAPEYRADYLIITADSLVDSFEQLRRWKSQKGLYAKIESIENITDNYTGSNIQMKIKNCIYDYYLYNSTKYVLLGGDETIIPVQMCLIGHPEGNDPPGAAPSLSFTTTPCDLFYACFQGQFDWDVNHNTVIGEVGDGIIMTPQLYLSRIPVKTSIDVLAYTNKLLSYECGTNCLDSGNVLSRLLFTGIECFGNTGGQSDTYYQSKLVEEDYISPTNWDGDIYYFLDTYTVLPGNTNYSFSNTNLVTEINRGYGFIVDTSHGHKDMWRFDDYGNYTTNHANSQENKPSSVILTTACETNHFDGSDFTLCEAFLNNPNGGAISYFGSSRLGWGNNQDYQYYLGESEHFNALFLNNLFTAQPSDSPYSFGAVAAKAKADLIDECGQYNYYRWLQFAINPMGDPEMPIFTGAPHSFTESNNPMYVPLIFLPSLNGSVHVTTGVSGCKVVMSYNGETLQVVDNTQNCYLQMPGDTCTFTVLKHNYYPYSETIIFFGPGNGGGVAPSLLPSGPNHISIALQTELENGEKVLALPKSGSWSVSVTNIVTGRVVANELVSTSQKIFDTSGWPSGVYAIRSTVEQQSYVDKIHVE
mgnify:CR=1 FL=1